MDNVEKEAKKKIIRKKNEADDYHQRALLMGKRLQELRKKFGISQTELAKGIHTTMPTISQLERGVRAIGPRLMARLSKFFNVPETYFLQRNTDATVPRDFYRLPGIPSSEVPVASWTSLEKVEKAISQEVVESGSEGLVERDVTRAAWFTVSVKEGDDSMEPEYRQKDIVVVNREINPVSGDDAVVLVNKTALCRKVIIQDDKFIFKAYNPAYVDISFPKSERGKSFDIIGRVMELRRPK